VSLVYVVVDALFCGMVVVVVSCHFIVFCFSKCRKANIL